MTTIQPRSDMFRLLLTAATAGALCLGAALPAAGADKKAPKWSYDGATGPANWHKLHPKNRVCAAGNRQSPFHIRGQAKDTEPAGGFHYTPTAGEMLNKGYTLQVNLQKGSYIMVEGKRYNLVQFHFHTPSEHHLNGKPYAMEMHLVHVSADGNLAVVGVMVESGGDGSHPIDKLPAPARAGSKAMVAGGKIDPAALLPKNASHFRFEGSLTTPPCTEGVEWHMMTDPVKVSRATLRRFQALMGKNNRPLQAPNGREVSHHN